MRVMILGAGGLLGTELASSAPVTVEVFPFPRQSLDLTDPHAVQKTIQDLKPRVIINAAAYTKVDQAESEPALAFEVNSEAVGMLGRLGKSISARVVHFSTDYVFDGTSTTPYSETAWPNPLNVYGLSKLKGERALHETGVDALLIRTQWLFGTHGHSFPKTMWERAVSGAATRVVNDQIGRPTFAGDVAHVTWELISRGTCGVMHLANAGIASWYDVAKTVFEAAGQPRLLEPCTTLETRRPARRPLRSVLCTERLEVLRGSALPEWRVPLARALHEFALENARASGASDK